MSNVGKSTNLHSGITSSGNGYQPYQGAMSHNIPAQNTSVDSSFKQQDKSVPSFLASQKQTAPQGSTKTVINNSYGYQSMGTMNPQSRPTLPINAPIGNPPQTIMQNPNIFKKH